MLSNGQRQREGGTRIPDSLGDCSVEVDGEDEMEVEGDGESIGEAARGHMCTCRSWYAIAWWPINANTHMYRMRLGFKIWRGKMMMV